MRCQRAAGWLIATLVCLTGVLATGYVSAAAPDVLLSNEYIAVTVNNRAENTGRFSIMTTGGDPDRASDDDAHLIYRREDQKGPWTSFTTFLIDDTPWVFGGPTRDEAGAGAQYGTPVHAPSRHDSGSINATWQLGPIQVTQSISIVRSSTTGLLDTARIAYELVNTSSQAHRVGVRIALDTMLGDNDGAPFRVGEKAITTDTVLTGSDIPEFWQAFDSLADPKVTAQGSLRGGVTTPNKVVFTNWGMLASNPWAVNVVPGRDFTREGGFDLDSAVALIWDPVTVAPGEKRQYVTNMGLGGLTIAPGQLRLALTSPSTVEASAGASFPVIAYVQNSGSGEARDVEVTINLPQGLRLAPGQQATRRLGNLPVGEHGQVRWNVQLAGATGQLTFQVRVTAMNADPNTASRRIEIVSPAQLQVKLAEPQGRLTVADGRWQPYPYRVDAVITNTGQVTAADVAVDWSSSRGLQLHPGDASYRYVGPLEPGRDHTVSWHVVPTAEIGDLPYTVRASAGSGTAEARANGLLRVPPLASQVNFAVVSNSGRSGSDISVGDTFTVYLNASNLKSAQSFHIELVYDPTGIMLLNPSATMCLGVDKGDVFVVEGAPADKEPDFKAKCFVDMTKPLGRVVITADRSPAPPVPLLSGNLAVLRLRALKPGSTTLRVDRLVIKDQFGQELQVNVAAASIAVREKPSAP